jgi:hypothetical protein
MKTIEVVARVDAHHRLSAEVPASVAPGLVRIALLVTDEGQPAVDEVEASWEAVVAQAWAEDLADVRQDAYTMQDGESVAHSASRETT